MHLLYLGYFKTEHLYFSNKLIYLIKLNNLFRVRKIYMGRVAEFSDDEIIEAGNQLLNSNKVVTPFGIRQIIGGGSAARIKMV